MWVHIIKIFIKNYLSMLSSPLNLLFPIDYYYKKLLKDKNG